MPYYKLLHFLLLVAFLARDQIYETELVVHLSEFYKIIILDNNAHIKQKLTHAKEIQLFESKNHPFSENYANSSIG